MDVVVGASKKSATTRPTIIFVCKCLTHSLGFNRLTAATHVPPEVLTQSPEHRDEVKNHFSGKHIVQQKGGLEDWNKRE